MPSGDAWTSEHKSVLRCYEVRGDSARCRHLVQQSRSLDIRESDQVDDCEDDGQQDRDCVDSGNSNEYCHPTLSEGKNEGESTFLPSSVLQSFKIHVCREKDNAIAFRGCKEVGVRIYVVYAARKDE